MTEKILGTCLNILQMHWTFAIKDDGTWMVQDVLHHGYANNHLHLLNLVS